MLAQVHHHLDNRALSEAERTEWKGRTVLYADARAGVESLMRDEHTAEQLYIV